MPLADYLALLALATAMAFTPGPNTTLAAAIAANRGEWYRFPINLRLVPGAQG